jgi:hypothetical protein
MHKEKKIEFNDTPESINLQTAEILGIFFYVKIQICTPNLSIVFKFNKIKIEELKIITLMKIII